MNGGPRTAPGKNLADALHLSQLLSPDGIGGVVNLRGRNIFRCQREEKDGRVGRIGLAIGRLAGKIGRKLAARGIDSSLHIARGGIDVAIEIELQRDSSGTEAAGGSHLRNASDAAELSFERSGHGGGHGLRACAREVRAHGNCGEIDLGQRRNGQKAKGHHARKKDCQGDERRGDRAPNEGNGKI